jgi:AAA domain-containing protein
MLPPPSSGVGQGLPAMMLPPPSSGVGQGLPAMLPPPSSGVGQGLPAMILPPPSSGVGQGLPAMKHEFFERLRENDRVVLVGDVRQHQAVDASRPCEQLQKAGMLTARLEEIVRQKDPALKEAVEQLARGEVREAIGNLDRQGRVHDIADREERMRAIADECAANPAGTLVTSPDNRSREELNRMIHEELQQRVASRSPLSSRCSCFRTAIFWSPTVTKMKRTAPT